MTMIMADVVAARLAGMPDPRQSMADSCKAVAEDLASRRARVRVFYGDLLTGEAWPEEYGVTGELYMVRPAREAAPYVCINGAALSRNVVAMRTRDRWVFLHPDFTPGKWEAREGADAEGYGATVMHNGTTYAHTRTIEQARRLRDFMSGARMTKGGRAPKE